MPAVNFPQPFPFCIGIYPPSLTVNDVIETQPTGLGSSGEYQIQLPLDACMRAWWTVRHWRVSFEYERYRDLGIEGSYAAGSFQRVNRVAYNFDSRDAVGRYRFNPVNEAGLICFDGYEEASQAFGWEVARTVEFKLISLTDPEDIEEGSFTQTNIVAGISFGRGVQTGFYPLFVRDSDKTADDPLTKKEQLWVNFVFQGIAPAIDPSTQRLGTLKILDQERVFFFYTANSPSITEVYDNVLIEPSEFWPYDPGDGGGPIYDTATGAQLRPLPL